MGGQRGGMGKSRGREDDGGSAGNDMGLTSYRRVLIQITNKGLKGGGGQGGEAIGDVMMKEA